jgi:dienelactone hydrolase
MWLLLAVALGVQQGPEVRVYRMMQSGTELGRETVRWAGDTIDRSVVVPILNLRLESRAEYDASGAFRRFSARVLNSSGDSLRLTWALELLRDSLIVTRIRGADTSRRVSSARRVDGVAPPQTLSVIAETMRRAGGRDTVLYYLPMGGDTALATTVRHSGDTVFATMAGVTSFALRSAGRNATIEIPAQRVSAVVWNGRDSLPALAGLRRPTPDYRAPAGAPYTAEDVRIPIRSLKGDTFSLAGTLTLPAAGRPASVVVTISGSGQQLRNEDLWPLLPDYGPFAEIADRLGRAGIGVLRYDDRGVGGSGGAQGTSADYADDVRQVVAWLRAREGVAPARVALLGHSEGGLIGPLVAAGDARVAAVVILAGPGKDGRAIVRDQLRRPIEQAVGLPADERARQLADLDKRVSEWVGMNPWTRWFADYDPLPVARRLRQPVLILHGALDRQVSVGQADTLAAAIRGAGNRDVTLTIYPRLNHLFLPTDGDGSPADYPGLPQRTLPAELLDTLTAWLVTRLKG